MVLYLLNYLCSYLFIQLNFIHRGLGQLHYRIELWLKELLKILSVFDGPLNPPCRLSFFFSCETAGEFNIESKVDWKLYSLHYFIWLEAIKLSISSRYYSLILVWDVVPAIKVVENWEYDRKENESPALEFTGNALFRKT